MPGNREIVFPGRRSRRRRPGESRRQAARAGPAPGRDPIPCTSCPRAARQIRRGRPARRRGLVSEAARPGTGELTTRSGSDARCRESRQASVARRFPPKKNPGDVTKEFNLRPHLIPGTRQPSRLASGAHVSSTAAAPECSPSLRNLPNRRLELYTRAFSSYDLRYSVGRSRKLDHDGAGRP